MKQKLTAALLDVSLRDSRFCAELLRMLTKGGEAPSVGETPSGLPQYIGRTPEEPLRSGVRVQTQGKTADISIVENAVPKEALEDMVLATPQDVLAVFLCMEGIIGVDEAMTQVQCSGRQGLFLNLKNPESDLLQLLESTRWGTKGALRLLEKLYAQNDWTQGGGTPQGGRRKQIQTHAASPAGAALERDFSCSLYRL